MNYGISFLHSIIDRSTSLNEAMDNAEKLYYNAAVRIFGMIKIGTKMSEKP